MSDNAKQERTSIETAELLSLAVGAAGPQRDGEYTTAYKQRVLAAAMDMYDMRFIEDLDRIAKGQPLLGIVKSVEETSNSYTITFIRISGKEEDRGTEETVRTEYKEPSARIVADRARALVGRKVRWFKVNTPNKTNWKDPKGFTPNSFRTIVGIVDLGPASEDDVPTGVALPTPAKGKQADRPQKNTSKSEPPSAPPPDDEPTAQAPAPQPASQPSQDATDTQADDVDAEREQLLDDPLEFARWLSNRFENLTFDDIVSIAKANNIRSKEATPTDLAKLEQFAKMESEQRSKQPANT